MARDPPRTIPSANSRSRRRARSSCRARPAAAHLTRRLALLTALLVLVRAASAVVVAQPGYTDSYYFTEVAARLARGDGLTADFIWSPIEAHGFALPVPSHLFWVPLPTALAGLGIALLGALLGDFRAAQAAIVLAALAIPPLTFFAARALGCGERAALAAAAVAGLGGIFAPGLVAVDAFAPAAVLGTAFFLAFRWAAAGSVRAGAVAGLLVGLLYLSRSEGALFGLALLALLRHPSARRAGLAGSGVALAIGLVWLVRDIGLGSSTGVLARSVLLIRYEDFFAFQPAYLGTADAPIGDLIGVRVAALVTNAATFAFAYALVLLPALVVGVRTLRDRADVRAWLGLAVLVYLAQSLLFTLHSTRGSYFHSLAALFPFGLAIAAAGAERVLASRAPEAAVAWLWGGVLLVGVVSALAVTQWDATFNGGTQTRIAALDAIPSGPFLAIDAAAWRWIGGRSVFVTPADGLSFAGCEAQATGARSLVLEAAHFSRYEELYTNDVRPSWLDAPVVRGTTKIYAIRGTPACGTGP
jgi:uncharacterized membrane protein YhaH (DUF805 family)